MKSHEKIILLILLIAGGALRFYGFDIHSMWNDELNTWEIAQMGSVSEIVDFMTYNEVHPPGYHFLLHFLINTFGDSIFVLKFLSAFFGTLSIIAIYYLGRLIYSSKEGLYAAALLAFSKFPVHYSQEVRPYSMLLFFSILALFYFVKMYKEFKTENKISSASLVLYLLISVISCYLHYFGLLFIFLQGTTALVYFIIKKKFSFPLFLVYLMIVAAYIPFLPMIPHHIAYGPVYILPTGPLFPVKYVIVLFGKSVFTALIPSALLIFMSYKLIRAGREGIGKNTSMKADIFLILLILIPIIILAVKSYISNPVLTYRNLIIGLPALYLLVARAITMLPFEWKIKNNLVIIYSIYLIFSLIFIDKYYSEPQKEQFKEATQFIVDNNDKFKDYTLVGFSYRDKYFDYYSEKLGLNRHIDYNLGLAEDTAKLKDVIIGSSNRYLCYFAGHRQPDSLFINYITEKYNTEAHTKLIGVEVWFFRVK